jgi:hypothetical protein|tara:strand:+ start:315 stop:428 length:114 start_codon:yes stop_codon:yes gene_type:complete
MKKEEENKKEELDVMGILTVLIGIVSVGYGLYVLIKL